MQELRKRLDRHEPVTVLDVRQPTTADGYRQRLPGAIVMEPDTAPRIVETPPDLKKALKASKAAQAAWDRYSYTYRKEFARWITEAKKPETRARRLEKSLEMLAAGRNLSQR